MSYDPGYTNPIYSIPEKYSGGGLPIPEYQFLQDVQQQQAQNFSIFPTGATLISGLGWAWINQQLAYDMRIVSRANYAVAKEKTLPFFHGWSIDGWYDAGVEGVTAGTKNLPNLGKQAYKTLSRNGPFRNAFNQPQTVNPYSSASEYLSGLAIHPNTFAPETNAHDLKVHGSSNRRVNGASPTISPLTDVTEGTGSKKDWFQISVPKGGAAITEDYTITFTSETGASVDQSHGWSSQTSVEATAGISASLGAVDASFQTTVGTNWGLNGDKTSSNHNTKTTTTTASNTYKVKPGKSIALLGTYTQGTLPMTYNSPAVLDYPHNYGAAGSFGAKGALASASNQLGLVATSPSPLSVTAADVYHYCRAAMVPGHQHIYEASQMGNSLYRLWSSGTVSLKDVGQHEIKEYVIIGGEWVSNLSATSLQGESQNDDLSTENAMESTSYTPHEGDTLIVNGVEKNIGVLYDEANKANGVYLGSKYDDRFYLNGPNQTVHTYSGEDHVEGSIYNDKIFADNNGSSGNSIESGDGDDTIRAINGGDYIDSGAGDDNVYVTLDDNLVDEINLGSGSDTLTIDLSKAPKRYGLTVNDLEYTDKHIFKGGSVEAEIFGTSVLLYSKGNHIATFLDYAKQFDGYNIHKLQEVGLLNMHILGDSNDYDYVADWRDPLITAKAEGKSIYDDYDSLLNSNSSALKETLKGMQEYFFKESTNELTTWGLAHADEYESASDFAHALLGQGRSSTIDLPFGYV
ncbi:hypothetical protein [Prochlorococcus sp. MIT 1303]|uniref:hypothetical protein n=1 Tax=Prochlorococcus sp. MIT 1303 TaxID=1723647 RepID=UPI0007B3958D|nr:hypothetical protein [Prochlorococcus sp. MIT 1303]KZR63362.1 hypothetical protein PMIT1303_01728 [Prochlorococcus sp. MIT 1303]